jgi:hypothetical protein
VRALAEMGIDPQEGLHERLIRELQKEGTNWRPHAAGLVTCVTQLPSKRTGGFHLSIRN